MTAPYTQSMTCPDGYQLTATIFPAQKENDALLPILICPATGIKQGFYRAFATWLAEQGYLVMSFDFRGIGQSLHGSVKDSTASIDDWGVLDLPTAIQHLIQLSQKPHIILMGHSAGGQLLGVAENYHRVKKWIMFGCSTGYVPQLGGKTRWLAPIMFDVIFPISSKIKGYGATKMIGMGENLPKKVAKQWADFCKTGRYIQYSIGKTIEHDYHAEISCPIHSFYATDDEIATEKNVRDFLALFPKAEIHLHQYQPKQHGFKQIGHMLWFKSSHQKLWNDVLRVL